MNKRYAALFLICALLLTACTVEERAETYDSAIPPLINEPQTGAEASRPMASDGESCGETAENTGGVQTESESSEEETRAETASADILPEGLELAVDGDFIRREDITEIYAFGDDMSDVWSYLVCDGFAYIAEPTGVSFNVGENADIFDAETHTFQAAPAYSEAIHKRVYTGDAVCGLTVKSARVIFDNTFADNEPHDPYGFRRTSTAEFEGELTLSGYLYAAKDNAPNLDYITGDVFFIPDNESCKLLPFIGGLRDVDKSLWVQNQGDFYYLNEYERIVCGNIYRDDFKLDFAEQADENGLVKAKITVSDIKMYSSSSICHEVRCKIKETEIISE